jgi:hypothetical protein
MPRVKIRALCLTLFAFAAFAPSANAAVADSLLPFLRRRRRRPGCQALVRRGRHPLRRQGGEDLQDDRR